MPVPSYHFLDELKRLPFVEAIYLFGSRARGTYGERSDIDLAVYCPGASPLEWAQVEDIVENADTLLEIDLILLDRESPDSPLRRAIESEKETVYERRAGARKAGSPSSSGFRPGIGSIE